MKNKILNSNLLNYKKTLKLQKQNREKKLQIAELF